MDGYWKAFVELNGKTLDEARAIFTSMADESESVVWYHHPSGRKGKGPHFHALVKNHKKTDETYRNRLKAEFGVKGPGTFAVSNKYDEKNPNAKRAPIMTEISINGYVKYMSKGVHEPFFNKGFSEEYLAERKAEWKPEHVSEVIDNRTASSRVTRVTMANQALALYNDRYVNADSYNEDGNLVMRMDKLVDIINEVCKSNNKGRDFDNCAKIGQTVLADLDPNYWRRKVLSRL